MEIVGPKGAGKTILLKQLANYYKDSFYISVDTIDDNLFETIKKLNETLKNIKWHYCFNLIFINIP